MAKRVKNRTVAPSLKGRALLPRRFRAIPASLVILALAHVVCPNARAAGCDESRILFAFKGTLFQVRPDRDIRPAEIAHGFAGLRDLTLSPDCARYAFIQMDALRVGDVGRPPRKAEFPGRVLQYEWSSDGQAVIATVDRPGCTPPVQGHGAHPVGSVFVARFPAFVPHQLTGDCGSSLAGGGTHDDRILLNRQSPLPDCPNTEPICAIADFVVLNMRSGVETTLLTAQQLREKGLSEPEGVAWSPSQDVVYLWTMISQIGQHGALLAVEIPSGRILWGEDCYGAVQLEGDLLAIRIRQSNEETEKMDVNWAHEYLVVQDGKVVGKYPLIPFDDPLAGGPMSRGGRYIAWYSYAPDFYTKHRGDWTMHFATKTSADVWRFTVPEGYEATNRFWTPGGLLMAVASRVGPDSTLVFVLWLLDPSQRAAREIFQGSYHLGPNQRAHPPAVGTPGPHGERFIFPLLPAYWQH